MTTATDGMVRGDWLGSAPLVQVVPERVDDPEWHTLRLFGRGRHRSGFASGVEVHDEL